MLIGGFILVFSVVALIGGASMAYKTLRVRQWPRTTAVILDKEVVRTDKATGSTRTARYEVRVRYQFMVEGREYEGSKVRPTLEITSQAEAQKLIDGLGGQESVYYNPRNPEEAYLATNSLAWSLISLVLGLFGTLIGAGMLLSGGKSGS
jgi:hypothetical protein